MKKQSKNKKFNSYLVFIGFAFILVLFIFQQNASLGELEVSIENQDFQVKNLVQNLKNDLYDTEELVAQYEYDKEKTEEQRISSTNTELQEIHRETAFQYPSKQLSDLKLGNSSSSIKSPKASYSTSQPYRPDIPLIISAPNNKKQNLEMYKAHISTYYKTSEPNNGEILSTEAEVKTNLNPESGYYQK